MAWPTEVKETAILAIQQGRTYQQVADSLGIPKSTIYSWTKEGRGISDVERKHGQKEGEPDSDLMARMKRVRDLYLDRVEELASTAHVAAAITGFGVVTDKIRLLSGEPTEIHQKIKLRWPHQAAEDEESE